MVKLRSRLIRSPFSGGVESSSASASSSTPNNNNNNSATSTAASAHFNNNNNIDFQHNHNQGSRGIGQQSNNHARQQSQRQRHVNRRRNNQGRRSQRTRMLHHQSNTSEDGSPSSDSSSLGASPPAAATSTSTQRRPFEPLGSTLGGSSPAVRRGSSSSIGNTITSPGKRKPETRGITASIRRAKTAMFRIASSPMTSSRGDHGVTVGSNSNAPSDEARVLSDIELEDNEQMDTSSSDDHIHASTATAVDTSYTSPMVGGSETAPDTAVEFQRTPSQEENVPPMALLSPNCGTYCAHAAGTDYENKHVEEDSIDMDVDGASSSAVVTTASALPATTTAIVRGVAIPVVTAAAAAAPRVKNVLEWMKEDAPPELLPKLLSFCGSRKMNALSRVNKAWNDAIKNEAVWQVVCEDTHKWSNGDEIPSLWSQFYKQNPVVPIDYDTVDAAFNAVSSGPLIESIENNVLHTFREQRTSCRILLHPGPYFLRRPLVANVAGSAEVTIEIIIGSEGGCGMNDPEHGMIWQHNYHKQQPLASTTSMEDDSERGAGDTTPQPMSAASAHFARADELRPSTPTLRQIFGSCGGRLSSSSAALAGLDTSSRSSVGIVGCSSDYEDVSERSKAYRAAFRRQCFRGPRPTALVCLETRRQNEPAVRVRRGTLNLRGIKFLHYCEGTDIWNGNAAVQVQTAFGRNGRPVRAAPPMVPPTANVVDCDITSLSGRGLVNIDGGISHVSDCNIHDSAATGLYVGGAGSIATMERTDVVENGVGNIRNPRRGVARGHSGVYVEQGIAKLSDCNISRNTLTGISAISTEQARLHIEGSDVRANRSDQMELPSEDSGRGVNKNNSISSSGQGRPRSRHLMDSVAVQEAADRRSIMLPSTPQSPREPE